MTINGVSVTGNNIELRNGVVYVDGVEIKGVQSGGKIAEVRILEGIVHSVTADGSVAAGDVTGSVSAGGSVNCDNIGGNVSAGGSVNCDDIAGSVMAGGSIRRG